MRRQRWGGVFAVGLTMSSLILANCQRVAKTSVSGASGDPTTTASGGFDAPVGAIFVGDDGCVGCHSTPAKTHKNSRHMHTLLTMETSALGSSAPPAGKVPGSDFTLKRNGERFEITQPAVSDDALPLDFALGSGKTGQTYVAIVDGGEKMVEFRRSYFAGEKTWYATPDQESVTGDSVGKIHGPANIRRCFSCHSVTIPETRLLPERKFFGVGCEACHGPGSAHVDAMKAGRYEKLLLPKLQDWPATRLNEMCGKCHGTAEMVKTARLPEDVGNRHQTYGLMKSPCFLKSRDTLSCNTCHAPHEDASTDPKKYDATCLSCHDSSRAASRPKAIVDLSIPNCKVNPKSGCTKCHMPERKAIVNSDIPTKMADHWIRVRRERVEGAK